MNAVKGKCSIPKMPVPPAAAARYRKVNTQARKAVVSISKDMSRIAKNEIDRSFGIIAMLLEDEPSDKLTNTPSILIEEEEETEL